MANVNRAGFARGCLSLYPKDVPLTQSLLAELANASAHTVAGFVDRVSHAGLIDWRYGKVRKLDVGSFAAFAAGSPSDASEKGKKKKWPSPRIGASASNSARRRSSPARSPDGQDYWGPRYSFGLGATIRGQIVEKPLCAESYQSSRDSSWASSPLTDETEQPPVSR
jgi:hypothetical protein